MINAIIKAMKQAESNSIQYYIDNRQYNKPRLLLHACCGPCALGALDAIGDAFDVTVFFYNPNILPDDEFIRRLDALKTVVRHFNVKLVVPTQSAEEYLSLVKDMHDLPEGGKRCAVCFDLRLGATARYLASHRDEYDFFATTLTVSPHKNAALINEIGEEAAEAAGVKYLHSDFKKRNGYLRSTQLSKELGIYRQNYCGCRFDD